MVPFEKDCDLLPSDPLDQRLCEFFSHGWEAIIRANKPSSSWISLQDHYLTPRVKAQLWRDSTQILGLRFDHETCYAVIDIDRDSTYHPAQNPEALPLIRDALEMIGICRTILIRSSWSGGLHLYIPLPSTVPTFGLAKAIKRCLEVQGFTISQGQLEIFPNCKAYMLPGSFNEYNGHRLPLQPNSGSCLVDDDGNPEADDLATFFQRWDIAAAAQDLDNLNDAIRFARYNSGRVTKRYSSSLENWKKDLDIQIEEGWTAHGQTNILLRKISCYGVVFQKLQGDKLVEFIIETAINSPGYRQWCRHQHEIRSKAKGWARFAEKFYWPAGSTPKRSTTARGEDTENKNVVRAEDAQRRIREIVSRLEQSGQFPATATARAKAIEAEHISRRTLYRYLELWHPEHYQSDSREKCKTQEPDELSAISEGEFEEMPKSPQPLPDKKFYTLKKNMKGYVGDAELCSGTGLDVQSLLLTSNSDHLEKPNEENPKQSTFHLPINSKSKEQENCFRNESNFSMFDSV